jgi:hypothetical protein
MIFSHFLADLRYLAWSGGFCKTCKFVEEKLRDARIENHVKIGKEAMF